MFNDYEDVMSNIDLEDINKSEVTVPVHIKRNYQQTQDGPFEKDVIILKKFSVKKETLPLRWVSS